MPKMTTRQRRRKIQQCGAGCFLDCCSTKARKAGHPRYPICERGCEPDCSSVLKAYRRAAQQHERKLKQKAKAIGKRIGCAWAKD